MGSAPHSLLLTPYDYLLDRQPVLPGEVEVAFVVRRHRHHRALAVAHEHVVADPHRNRFAGERMRDIDPRRHALLLDGREIGLHHRAALALLDEGREFRVALRGMGRKRMLGRDRAESHTHNRVGARGEDPKKGLIVACPLTLIPTKMEILTYFPPSFG